MSSVEQVQQLLLQFELALRQAEDRKRNYDLRYRMFLLADGEMREANRACAHARSQLEALAVAGLSKPPAVMPESLRTLTKADQVELPAVQQEQGLSETELATLQQAEAEDNAAEAVDIELPETADDNVAMALADNDPPVQVIDIPAPPSRVAVFVRAAEREENRVQSLVKALDVEQKAESVPVITRVNKPWQALGEAFTRPVLLLLADAHGPVALATIIERMRGLYTSDTTKVYLRDMVASGHVQKIGVGFYARKDWRPPSRKSA